MLLDQIKKDQVQAMKTRQLLKLSVLRMLLSAASYKQIDLHKELTDAEVLIVIFAEAKKRREAIASFQAANRADQVASEQQELDILSSYLPKQLTEAEIRQEILAMAEIKGLTDFGQVMRLVAPKFKDRADGSLVAGVVKQLLGNG